MAKGKKKTTKKKKATKKPVVEETPAEEVKEEATEEKPVKEEVAEEKPPEVKKEVTKKPKKKEIITESIEDVPSEYVEMEYTDVFDKKRAYNHTESLAKPRLVGTEGEKEAANYIQGKFSGMGLKPVEEKFSFTDWSFKALPRITEGIESALLIVILLLISISPALKVALTPNNPAFIVALVLSGVLLVYLFYTSIQAKFFWMYQNVKGRFKIFESKEYTSQNIVAKVDCTKGSDAASGEIILLAHYDSKSQTWPMFLRATLFYIESIATIIFPIGIICLYALIAVELSLLSSGAIILSQIIFAGGTGQTVFLTVLWVFAFIDLGTFVFLELNKTGNKSAGALDNASGLGVFLELAENYSKAPLENYNLTFVATGAEELGLMGTVAYLKAHEAELDKDITYFINLKVTGVRGHFYIPGPVGFPPHLPCLEVENLYKKVVKRRQIPFKEGSNKKIKVVSPWVFGAWNDDMVPLLRGFNGNRISIGGVMRRYDIIHSEDDTIDQVDIEAMDIVGKVTAEVLTRLDLRARP